MLVWKWKHVLEWEVTKQNKKAIRRKCGLGGTFLLKRIFCIKKQLSIQSFENYKKCLILNFYAKNDANSCIGHIVHYLLVKK